METIKLSYFGLPIRAEPIRLAFAIGGIKFENEVFGLDKWPSIKQNFKYLQVPVLHVNGQQYAQSLSILRYAALRAGLVPSDPLEYLKTDQLATNSTEFFDLIIPTLFQEGETQKNSRQKLVKEDFPKLLGFIEKDLQGNGSNGFGAGKKLYYGDIALYTSIKFLISGLEHVPQNIIDAYPSIKKVVDQVGSNKQVQEWYKSQ